MRERGKCEGKGTVMMLHWWPRPKLGGSTRTERREALWSLTNPDMVIKGRDHGQEGLGGLILDGLAINANYAKRKHQKST